MTFFLLKKGGAHFQYACNIRAMCQTYCWKAVRGVDYRNFLNATDGRFSGYYA